VHSTPTRLRMGPPTIFDARARSAQVRSSSLPQESACLLSRSRALRRRNTRPILLDKPFHARDLIDAHAQKESLKLGQCRFAQVAATIKIVPLGSVAIGRCFGTLRHFVPVRGKITGHLPYPEPPTAWRATATRPLPSIRRLARCVLGGKHGEERGCTKGQRKRGVKKGKRNGRAKKSTKVLLTRKCGSHDTPVALVIVFPL
jgi:hypothetical protein